MSSCIISGIPLSPWSPWSPCSVSCGKGTTTRYREGHVTEEFKYKYPLLAEVDCYKDPCPGGKLKWFKATISFRN